jgi:hypothetical protein
MGFIIMENAARMELNLNDRSGKCFLEGSAGHPLLRDVADAARLIEACFNHRIKRVLLHAENLTDQFFDLSSLEAGSILQKLRTYNIRLAVLSSSPKLSTAFRDLLLEESRHKYFRLFEDRQKAEMWLVED